MSRTHAPTDTQRRVLSFVQGFIESNKMPPSRQEIAEAFKWRSSNSAETHLRAMAKHGLVELIPHTSRGIRVLERPTVSLPERTPLQKQALEVKRLYEAAEGQNLKEFEDRCLEFELALSVLLTMIEKG